MVRSQGPVCGRSGAELIQCRICGKVQCITPDHNHMPRTKARTNNNNNNNSNNNKADVK